MITLLPLALAVLGPRAALAQPACSEVESAAQLQVELTRAETAFANLQVESFLETSDEVIFSLPCLGEALDQEAVARLHRLQGLRQYVAGESERAVLAFASARAADPSYVLPTWLVPEGHALRDLYGQFPLENAVFEPAPRPREGSLRFDGLERYERPQRWPTLVQVLDGAGLPVSTAYVFPGDALPAYPMVEPEPESAARVAQPRRAITLSLAGSAALAGVASGLLYGAASAAAADFEADQPTWDRADLEGARRDTNTLVVASGATAALGVGLGATALLLVQW